MSLKEILEKNRSFTFRFITFREVKESLHDAFGTSSNTVLYYAAIKAGQRACRRRLEVANSRDEVLKLLAKDKSDQNWGDITFEKIDWENCSGKVVIVNSFEAREVSSKTAVCFFLKGYLVGFLSELLQNRVVMSEDKCSGKGDARCEFNFQKEKQQP